MAYILIADDDINIRCLFRCLLVRAGYTVVEADDGEEALSIIQQQIPDLLITDILMPNKEGLELIQEVKIFSPQIKIIALSGGGVVDLTDCLSFANEFGADLVFPKPIKPDKLLSAVQGLLMDSYTVAIN